VADPVGDGSDHLGPAVAAFDRRMDTLFDRVRGNRTLDSVFLAASHLGDWSLIWHLTGLVRGVARRRPEQILALGIALGAESLIVNQGIKRLVKRDRPTVGGADGLAVREPSTSSFPSGHASSAAFAATILLGWDGRRWAPLWIPLAVLVGLSRVHVRIHHASDVVAGAVVGHALSRLAQRVLR